MDPAYLTLFLRAWLMVTLVAANTVLVSRGRFGAAALVGFAINYTWRRNARSSVELPGATADVAYALGAAAGIVTGMWLVG